MSPVYIFHYKKLKKLFFSTTASAKSYSGSSQGANGINGSLRPIMPDWGLTDSAIRLSWAKHYATKRRRIINLTSSASCSFKQYRTESFNRDLFLSKKMTY
jgi:hypothetical protein